jgi:hypothetical protein
MTELGADKKRRGRKPKISADEIADALVKAHGLVSVAVRYIERAKTEELGKPFTIARQVVERRIKNTPRLTEVMAQCDAEALDFAENKLMQHIKDGDTTSLIFYLKCKGKHRGYVEKSNVELSSPDNTPVRVIVDYGELPDDGTGNPA